MTPELRTFIVYSTEDGGLKFHSDYHHSLFKTLLKKWLGKKLWLTIDPRLPKRTERQNRFLWLYYGIISQESGHTPEELHEIYKDQFLPKKVITYKGETKEYSGSTRELTKQELTDYLDKICADCGVPIPDTSLFDLAPLNKMRYNQLEQLAIDGRLTVSKTLYRERERFAKHTSLKREKYRVFSYQARTEDMPEGQFYKITRKDLKTLLQAGAKVGEMYPLK